MHGSLEILALFNRPAMHHIEPVSKTECFKAQTRKVITMNIFERAFGKFVEAREAQAERYVNEYMADRGLDSFVDLTMDPRG